MRGRGRIAAGARQRGMSLVGAIFLIVVLAALGAYLVTVTSVQHQVPALSVQGARAWFAALSGLEWAIVKEKATTSCDTNGASFDVEGFTVTVQCDDMGGPFTEGGGPPYELVRLTVTATRGSAEDQVRRTVTAVVKPR